jgi:hypothetical protein
VAEAANRNFIINFGPQHPVAHGVLRLVLELDGEVVGLHRPSTASWTVRVLWRFHEPHIKVLWCKLPDSVATSCGLARHTYLRDDTF